MGGTIGFVTEPAGRPETGDPATEELATAEPAGEELATAEPAGEEPATEQPPGEEPAAEDAATEESAAEEFAGEAAGTEEPPGEEPATEEPATEDAATQEPAGEDAATEDTGARGDDAVPADGSGPETAPAEEPRPAPEAPTPETAPAGRPRPAAAAAAPAAAADRSSGIGTPIPSAATTGGLNSGDIVSGVVSSVARRELELDLGSGRTGVIGSRHWAAGLDVDLTVEAKVGDTVEAAVLVREDHKQRIVLSRSWGRQQRAWETAEGARKTGEIISGTVTDAVAAGLTVDIGVRAFVPASMAGDDDLESLVGTVVEFKVTEVNQLKGRCILSRKAALRTRERQAARKRLADLEPGTVVRARVTKVEDFGALVLADGDLRGRIRRSELSWFRVRRPGDVLSVGDEVEAKVLHTTPAKMSLDLSLRLGDDPLAGIGPGERHQATVTSLAPFGAFVTVGDGIRGLVPTAELSEHPIRHPREVVVPGDSVLAEVTKVDRQRRELEFSVNLAMLVRPAESGG